MTYPAIGTTTIGALLDRAVDRYGERPAIVMDGERLTFAELRDRVDALGRWLMAAGVAPADSVAIWQPNSIRWIEAYLAITRIGAVVVPINSALQPGEAAEILRRAGSRLVIAGGAHRGRPILESAALAVDGLDVTVVDRDEAAAAGSAAPAVSAEEYARRCGAVSASDPCLLLYSSGTTGRPKGVLHSHRVVDNMMRAADRQGLDSSDVLVHYLPLGHIFGAASVLSFLYAGGCLVLLDVFDAGRALDLMEAEGATVVYGIGAMYYDLVRHPSRGDRDLSRVRLCMVSGPADLVRDVDSSIGPAIGVWGMTEACGISTLPDLADRPFVRFSNGRALPDVSVRVVSAEGEPVEPGVRGDLQVRGVGLMLGYLDEPERTAAAMADGWLRTGDVARLGADGELEFVGRSDDALRVGGEMVDPAEVEAVLSRHPAVAGAAVAGLPHERLGVVPCAFITVKPGADFDEAAVVEFAAQQLAAFKVPRTLFVLDAFPTTDTGKIRKSSLDAAAYLCGRQDSSDAQANRRSS
jgi:acyl-CoA synthetase (AMP-forming)/AMP-acid ligase II